MGWGGIGAPFYLFILRWRRSPVFERFSRFHFSILFWKYPADSLGSRGVTPVTEGRLAASRRKGKADLRGSASFVDASGKNSACKGKRKNLWAFTPNKLVENKRPHKKARHHSI